MESWGPVRADCGWGGFCWRDRGGWQCFRQCDKGHPWVGPPWASAELLLRPRGCPGRVSGSKSPASPWLNFGVPGAGLCPVAWHMEVAGLHTGGLFTGVWCLDSSGCEPTPRPAQSSPWRVSLGFPLGLLLPLTPLEGGSSHPLTSRPLESVVWGVGWGECGAQASLCQHVA